MGMSYRVVSIRLLAREYSSIREGQSEIKIDPTELDVEWEGSWIGQSQSAVKKPTNFEFTDCVISSLVVKGDHSIWLNQDLVTFGLLVEIVKIDTIPAVDQWNPDQVRGNDGVVQTKNCTIVSQPWIQPCLFSLSELCFLSTYHVNIDDVTRLLFVLFLNRLTIL